MLFHPSTKQAGNTKDQEPLEEVKIKNRQTDHWRLPQMETRLCRKVESLETLRMMVMQESVFPPVFLRDESAALSIRFLLPRLSEPLKFPGCIRPEGGGRRSQSCSSASPDKKKKYLYPKMTQQAGLRFYIITFPTQARVFFTQQDTWF